MTGVRPARPSLLDPGPDGVMPTVLRPTHPAVRHRYAPRRSWIDRLPLAVRTRVAFWAATLYVALCVACVVVANGVLGYGVVATLVGAVPAVLVWRVDRWFRHVCRDAE